MSRCKLEEFISYEQPSKYIVDSDQYDDSFEIPVLTAGKSFILGYIDETNNIFDNLPVIIFDDFTTSVQFVDFPFKVKSSAMKLLKNTEQADIKYCYYLLKFLQHTPENHKRQWLSATSQNIVELPTIEKQKNIVRKLDKILEVIDNQNKQLELLDEAIKARFVEMFGDPIENTYSFPILKLGELSELITKGASPSWQGYSYTEDSTQTLFVTSENVREGYMDFSSIKYVEDAFNEKQKRSMIQKGDYLINIVGASIGRPAQFNMDCKANMNQAAALVRIKDNTISDNYLLYYLNSDKAQMMYNSMKSDTGRANLSLQDIANLEILVPDLTLQVKFSSFVQEVDKSRFMGENYVLISVILQPFHKLIQ